MRHRPITSPQHEPFARRIPLQLSLVIGGEILERSAHLLVAQEAREPPAALDLLHQSDTFVFHGHRRQDSSHAPSGNVVACTRVPSGAEPKRQP